MTKKVIRKLGRENSKTNFGGQLQGPPRLSIRPWALRLWQYGTDSSYGPVLLYSPKTALFSRSFGWGRSWV